MESLEMKEVNLDDLFLTRKTVELGTTNRTRFFFSYLFTNFESLLLSFVLLTLSEETAWPSG